MAYEQVDDSRTWRAVLGNIKCPNLIRVAAADTPYFSFDFSERLTNNSVITSLDSITEVASQSHTSSDLAVSGNGKRVSFKLAALPAGDYEFRANVTLSGGTTNKISLQGTLRVV
jgi:hypothetical protein